MGCCKSSSSLKSDKKRYNKNHLNEHCFRMFQLEYFKQQQKKIQQNMLQKWKQIQEVKIKEIEEKQQTVQAKYQKILINARAEPEKVRQIELRRNMTIEQIIGLEAKRRKFIEIKNIVRKNISKVNDDINENMRLRFDLIESQLKQGLLKIQQTNQQIDQIAAFYSNFLENRKQEIERGKKQVNQKIQKAFNFQKYTAKYNSVIPNQQLMALTLNQDMKQLPLKSIRADQFQQTEETDGVTNNSCCCFPED